MQKIIVVKFLLRNKSKEKANAEKLICLSANFVSLIKFEFELKFLKLKV